MSHREWILFLALLICYSFFVQATGNMQVSRVDMVMAMAYDGTMIIDKYHENTPEKAFRAGHYYSDKAPGPAFLGLPVYLFLDRLQGLHSYDWREPWFLMYVSYMLTALIVAPASALLVLLVYRAARALGGSETHSLLVALTLGLGTIAFPFATELFGHNLAALCAFAAFFIAFLVRQGRWRTEAMALSGLLIGAGVFMEYSMGVIAVLLGLYTLLFLPRRWASFLWFVAGGIPAAVGLMVYNTVNFGGPLEMSYLHQATPWAEEHQRGLLGVTMPQLGRLLGVLFHPRGLIFLCPVLILSPVGFWAMWRQRRWRPEFWLCLSVIVVFLYLNSSYFAPWGGWGSGPRFLIPTLPFLVLPLTFLGQRWRWPFLVLLLLSMGMMFLVTYVSPKVPAGPRHPFPLLDFWLPRLRSGRMASWMVTQVRFGWRRRYGLLALFLALSVAGVGWLASGQRWRRPRLGNGLAWASLLLLLGFYLLIALPIDLRQPRVVPPWFETLKELPAHEITLAPYDAMVMARDC